MQQNFGVFYNANGALLPARDCGALAAPLAHAAVCLSLGKHEPDCPCGVCRALLPARVCGALATSLAHAALSMR